MNIARAFESFRQSRKMTVDLLKTLNNSKLGCQPCVDMGTLGQQFRHMADISMCYEEAIWTGRLNFKRKRRNHRLERSVVGLRKYLGEVTKKLDRSLRSYNPRRRISWAGRKVDIAQHLGYLNEHEIPHHGELIVYFRVCGLTFPRSWSAWGL